MLATWSNFYVMIGSSAAALTGLMFVVITLVTGEERSSRSQDGIATFSTPTVMHFGAALLVAAVLIAPWHSLIVPSVILGIEGLYGVSLLVRIVSRTKRLREYRADLEDWFFYIALPFVAYGGILGGAIALSISTFGALYALAGGAVLLIFIGIRNAWDVVTFLAVGGVDAQ